MENELKKEIIDILKKDGLEIAEETAVQATKAAFSLLKILLPKVSNGFGSFIVPMLGYAQDKVLELIDEIDGIDSPEY